MNNEEKANKIAMPCPACPCIWTKEKMYNQEYCKDCVSQDRFTGAMEMAKWKDEQFKHLLIEKTKLLSSSAAQDSVKRCTIEEIYRELFNEEIPNSNPYIK